MFHILHFVAEYLKAGMCFRIRAHVNPDQPQCSVALLVNDYCVGQHSSEQSLVHCLSVSTLKFIFVSRSAMAEMKSPCISKVVASSYIVFNMC